uniref:Uncharacterized protein n=1 Tax=Sphaerodactylus townsendi TaxID=933632 RepID=A0ACB8E9E4_9SAUR
MEEVGLARRLREEERSDEGRDGDSSHSDACNAQAISQVTAAAGTAQPALMRSENLPMLLGTILAMRGKEAQPPDGEK